MSRCAPTDNLQFLNFTGIASMVFDFPFGKNRKNRRRSQTRPQANSMLIWLNSMFTDVTPAPSQTAARVRKTKRHSVGDQLQDLEARLLLSTVTIDLSTWSSPSYTL